MLGKSKENANKIILANLEILEKQKIKTCEDDEEIKELLQNFYKKTLQEKFSGKRNLELFTKFLTLDPQKSFYLILSDF